MKNRAVDAKDMANLEKWFRAWTVTLEQESRMKKLRQSGFDFARVVLECVAPGEDRATAIRHIRDAMLTARDSVASEMAHGDA